MRTLGRRLVGLFVLLAALAGGRVACAQAPAAAASPKPTPATAQAASKSETVVLDTPGGRLHGTLELPARGAAPHAVALIISGSGPTDRNGNSSVIPGANNSLKYLAEGLAAAGIASLRYDKRGVAESVMAAKSEEDLRFDTYIEDAVLWGQRLRADKRFGALVVVGHSEGSLIGMVAARRLGAEGFVSVAGAGRRADVVILEQMKQQLSPELYAKTEEIFRALAEGKVVADVPPALAPLFRPSVQPYVGSWLRYDPAAEVSKLKVPVLIAQGEHDLQVSVEDARLLSKAQPSAKLLLVAGMNHVLKDAPSDASRQAAAYSDPALPVAPKLLAEVIAFVKGIKK
jgi:fermentation-respiration switch protein FrsA (DUF1100 family)